MGLPFNFFGFTELPFILQGSFLFGEDWNVDWRWSGYHTGINGDTWHNSFTWSGDYLKDVDPEQYNLDWKWSGRFSGVHDEFLEAIVHPYGEHTGILTEAAFLTLNWSGSYVEDRIEYYHITNNMPHLSYSGVLEEETILSHVVDDLSLKPVGVPEKLTLSHALSVVSMGGGQAHKIKDDYTYSFAVNGIYQKDPSQ